MRLAQPEFTAPARSAAPLSGAVHHLRPLVLAAFRGIAAFLAVFAAAFAEADPRCFDCLGAGARAVLCRDLSSSFPSFVTSRSINFNSFCSALTFGGDLRVGATDFTLTTLGMVGLTLHVISETDGKKRWSPV